MNRKAPRMILASIALLSLVGLSAPAGAAPSAPQARNVWCC